MIDASAVVMLVTAPSQNVAGEIVRAVVEDRLAACGNILPGITSIYRWQGAVQEDTEVLILFKTERAAAPRLMERVQQLHPYEVPEAIVLPVVEGLPPYLAWIADSVDV
jgi:periplasmic divalent cation tolerance protein